MKPDKDTPGKDKPGKAGTAMAVKSRAGDRDMGSALRSVYQQTVEEQIPSEMLDLLGKLD